MFFRRMARWRVQRKRRIDEQALLRYRVLVLQGLVVVAFSLLTLQLWRLQVVEGAYYRERAEENRLRLATVAASRGVIYDRTGTLLVENQPGLSVAAVVADIPVPQQREVAEKLEQILEMPADEIAGLMDQRRTSGHVFTPITLKAGIGPATAFVLEEHHRELPGVSVLVEPRRHYKDGQVMPHILGYVGRISAEEYEAFQERGYDLNDTLGKMGVEWSYEMELRGQPGREQVEVDVNGRRRKVLGSEEAKPGHNLVLTIDLDLQRETLRILREGMGPSRFAAVAAMNPQNGELLALVSHPTFNNNIFGVPMDVAAIQSLLQDPLRPMINYAIGGAYPPGSVYKLITGTAALQERVASPGTVILSQGSIWVGNFEFKEWQPGGLGALNFQSAVAWSSDVYFYHLAGGYRGFPGLGVDRLARYSRMYGLGEATGVNLPGETGGLVPDEPWKRETFGEPWYIGDSYNMGIGQGYVLVSPLQMARAVSALANGGELLQPRVVKQLRAMDGTVAREEAKVVQRRLDIAPAHLRTFAEGMQQAVLYGTARSAAVPGVAVASKTGTAEFGVPRGPNRRYDTHGWSVSFAPFDNPEIALAVLVEQGTGSFNADPIAGRILRYYFARKGTAGAQ